MTILGLPMLKNAEKCHIITRFFKMAFSIDNYIFAFWHQILTGGIIVGKKKQGSPNQ